MPSFSFGWLLFAAISLLTFWGFHSTGGPLRWKMYTQISLLVKAEIRDDDGQLLDRLKIGEYKDIWVTPDDLARVLDQEGRAGRHYSGTATFLTGYDISEFLVRKNQVYTSDA
jgi:hypothetical protein